MNRCIRTLMIFNNVHKAWLFFTLFLPGLTCQVLNGQPINNVHNIWQYNNVAFPDDSKKNNLFSSDDFYEYSRARDDGYAEYLKETWSDYTIFDGLSERSRQYMRKLPVFYDSDSDLNPPVNLHFSKIVGSSYKGTGQLITIPRIRKPESVNFNIVKGAFRFYGQSISINYDKLLQLSKINLLTEDSLSGFWNSFSRSNSNYLVDQLMDYRDLLGLGDWGYFQLVKSTSNCIFTGDPLNADLLTWALMIRSGFDVRLAFNQNSTSVLFPSENTIYLRQFVVIGQTRFYLDRKMNSQLLVTNRNPFPDNVRMINLEFFKSLNFAGQLSVRKYSMQWNGKNYNFSLHFNPWIIRFYNDYPQTDSPVYFGAPVSSTLKEDLLGQISPVLSMMENTEAVAFLQQFIQKKFDYKSTDQNDDTTQSRFAEEMVASKSGDDRSKAVLFSWLIRILLRSPVVGVQFADHFSTAVCFDAPVDGDFYYLDNEKYYFTDPTIRNLPIGIMMPELEGEIPQLIDLSNSFKNPDEALKIWEEAFKLGARRGGTNQDIVFDRQGRALITGYLTEKRSYFPFIACFTQGKSLQWIRKFEGNGKAVAFSITQLNEDEIYVAGSFHGKIEMDGKELQSDRNRPGLFIAQFNQNGELIWLNKARIDTPENESLAYAVKFNRAGENITVQWSNEDERNIRNGFCEEGETGICLVGSGNFTAGMVPLLLTGSNIDISKDIYNGYNLLIGKKYNRDVAGVLSVMKQLQKSGAEVTGVQLQKLISRYSPSFQVSNALLYNAIGLIGLLKNENGLVTLKTIGGKSIIYHHLNLGDGSRFSLTFFNNGDLSVSIISGFKLIVNQGLLLLNNILIDCSSGKMIVDFDYDHTLKTVSTGVLPVLK